MSQKNCNCIACTENWPAVLAPNVNNINGKIFAIFVMIILNQGARERSEGKLCVQECRRSLRDNPFYKIKNSILIFI